MLQCDDYPLSVTTRWGWGILLAKPMPFEPVSVNADMPIALTTGQAMVHPSSAIAVRRSGT